MEQKLNLTQQKHAFANQIKCTTTQNKPKKTQKLKPGLVAFNTTSSLETERVYSKKKISVTGGGGKYRKGEE